MFVGKTQCLSKLATLQEMTSTMVAYHILYILAYCNGYINCFLESSVNLNMCILASQLCTEALQVMIMLQSILFHGFLITHVAQDVIAMLCTSYKC